MPGGRLTIAEIAERAGVSQSAVSLAINGRPGISGATRHRVLEVAAELGWRPSSTARALTGARVGVVGLVLARRQRMLGVEPSFMDLISGIQDELSRRGLALLFKIVEDTEAEIATYRAWWAERRVDGVLLVDLHVEDARIPVLEHLGLPALVIGGPGGHGALHAIWADDAAAMESLITYLTALGHRRLARIGGSGEYLNTIRRAQRFRALTQRLGVSGTWVEADDSDPQGASAARRLLTQPLPPTAIIFENDVMAIAGLAVAQELGRTVPEELSIVAWDDSPLCRSVHPQLTALSRDTVRLGLRAASFLIEMLDGAPAGEVEESTASITERGSTGPPPELEHGGGAIPA
jgi:DNA-binding LacI/PurR family transcriptional regulator